ncbi:MAG: SDR family NAD(P)-dependent oxidoreductase [Acidimicrobiales bacterium]|nr:SDR family NAD(P)-dependent oxidoreductase [Acidimicrobiales bacterium]
MGTRTAIVTGANSGIGLETARGIARAGYRTVLWCRDPQKAAAAKVDIDGTARNGHTEIVLADLASQTGIRRAVDDLDRRVDTLDLLVNNAAAIVRKRTETDEGVDAALAINHLGPFLLTNLLLPKLRAAPSARIVNVASDAHKLGKIDFDDLQATGGYGPFGFPRYGQTKLMNVLFTRELARRLADTEITANSVHPGAVRTNLGHPPAVIRALVGLFFQSPEDGARTSLAAALDAEFAEVTGSYFVKGRPADHKLAKAARDDEAAARLWTMSEELTGLS